jgi:ATP-dependent DNA helicase RecG
MTATPIPRTVAISVFGDLEVSTLTELPAGRQEISTFVVEVSNAALVSRMWQRVSEEIASGRQAFVVCPRIDGKDSEESSNLQENDDEIVPASAVEVFESLKRNASLAGFSIGLMHGKLSSEEKAEVMTAFSANEIQVLVSTTVIEVGVNVPNASAMVILDAEHFGISQLHQLRGRVGRGAHSGICFLTTAASQGSVSLERLKAVAGTTDGFKLSELDLEIRGEGDVLGNVQSGGRSQLKLLRVIRDADLIAKAREISLELLQAGLSTELSQAISGDASALEQS